MPVNKTSPKRGIRLKAGRDSRVIAVCLPVVVVISRTIEPDLFDLVPKIAKSDGYLLLPWRIWSVAGPPTEAGPDLPIAATEYLV
jgi:hypothetical protein